MLYHGLAAVESACAEALEAGLAIGDVILTVLARRRQRPGRCRGEFTNQSFIRLESTAASSEKRTARGQCLKRLHSVPNP